MSISDHPGVSFQLAEDTLSTDDETASLIVQIGTDPLARRMAEFNQIVAASLVALCAASPYRASILLHLSEEHARRLGDLTPLQVHELATSSSFLVVASPVLPVLVDEILDPNVDAAPALFAYATRRGRTDAGS